jgi:hypothetical protein
VALLEPSVVVPNNVFPTPSTSFSLNPFNRFRSQLCSLFTTNRTTTTTPNNNNNNNDNNNSIQTNQFDIYERHNPPRPTSIHPILLTTRSHLNSDFIQPPRELPPPYTEEQLIPSNNPTINSLSTTIINSRRNSSGGSDIESTNPTTTTSSLYRLRKRQIPVNTLRDRMRQFISGTANRGTTDDFNHPMQPTTTTLNINLEEQPPVASIEDDEQPSSDDDKMLTP